MIVNIQYYGSIACRRVRQDEDAFLPTKREIDSDYDLFASRDIILKAQDVTEVPTNIAIEYPDGYEGKVEDKSGWARKKVTIFGGVIDGSYTGEHIIVVFNSGNQDLFVSKGKAIAQLHLRKKEDHFVFNLVDRELKKTERGDGGFGSTGV